MNVLSLFNGFSGGKLALETLGVEVGTYYSSEIDKYANQATQAMFDAKPLTFTQWGMAFHKDEFDGASLGELDVLQDKYMMGNGDAGDNDYCITYDYDEYLDSELHKKTRLYQLGSVTEWREWDIDWASIDLVTGGFPCQAWSMAGKQLGDKDERGMLFWVMLDIIKHVKHYNPKADFLIENVKMKKEFEEYITTHTENALGYVHKILINSALVSAQNRNRYYWTSFVVEQPEDKGILLKDIIEHDGSLPVARPCELRDKSPMPSALCHHVANATDINSNESNKRVYADTGKGPTLTTMGGGHREPKVLIYHPASIVGRRLNERGVRDDYNKSVPITQCLQVKHNPSKTGCLTTVDKDNVLSTEKPGRYPDAYGENPPKYRKLTPRECFRLQTVPEHHIDTLLSAGISNSQLYKMAGNGFTIDVISHILSHLK